MPQTPTLDPGTDAPSGDKSRTGTTSVVLAVYAPFGTDQTLSVYPSGLKTPVLNQNLVRALQLTAAEGVNVSCLIDLYDDDSYLVEIPAFQPAAMSVTSVWKQDMSAPQALAGFLRRTQAQYPRSAIVLAIEGHGGGFVPDIDRARLTPDFLNKWSQGSVRWIKSSTITTVEPEEGPPPLGIGSPELGIGSPELPVGTLPMSTWAVGEALRSAQACGVPRLPVLHFNNCFNASVELLHTVAPYADYATGYANYDFFTAGDAYPKVFRRLRLAGSATAAQLARWFAEENRAQLDALWTNPAAPGYPTEGASVALAKMRGVIGSRIDDLGLVLTKAMQNAGGGRAALVALIQNAIAASQHYDTDPGRELDKFDEFFDIASFATQLQRQALPPAVLAAAAAVQAAVAGLYVYGTKGLASVGANPAPLYDFSNPQLSLNIFFPDPMRQGRWDWRSPYYLSGAPLAPNQSPPPAPQRHVIDFLNASLTQGRNWVAFIREYHRDVVFVGFLPAQPFFFPLANPRGTQPPGGTGNPGGPAGPGNPTSPTGAPGATAPKVTKPRKGKK